MIMARMAQFLTVLTAFSILASTTSAIGVNYGAVADNLPPAATTLALVKTTSINKIKLYDARPEILTAFAGSGIDIIIGAGNDQIAPLAQDPNVAVQWVAANVVPYKTTSIVAICLGNEVLAYSPDLSGFLLPAMQNLHSALVAVKLGDKVKVSTPHSLAILAKSFPPSLGTFHIRHANVIGPMLSFLSQTGSPFMINVYPYFAYGANPKNVSLDYALFQPNAPAVTDKTANLVYTNMFDAQVDAIYAALGRIGYNNISVLVAETGWPSLGEATEVGASVRNAQLYNSGLIKHIESGVGTPGRPNVTVETYIFALYNENQKPGPLSEKNWGLFLPTGTEVYNSGLNVAPGNTVPAPAAPIIPPPTPTTPTAPTTPGVPTAPTVPGAPIAGASWCVAKAEADPTKLQNGINYACGEGKANCGPLQEGSPCFEPNNLISHASFAYNSYYQINNRNYWNCFFDDTGIIVTTDPSTPTCKFPVGA